jgi:hypothetical protein
MRSLPETVGRFESSLMPLYVIMHDETERVCPVEAATPDEARKIAGERLGCDVSCEPIYCADNDDDLEQIIAIALLATNKAT